MNVNDSILIVGAGGHAKVILSTLLAVGKKVLGFLDDDESRHGTQLLGHTIIGSFSSLKERSHQAAVIAVGDNKSRKRIADQFNDIDWITVIHPHAYVHDFVSLGKGTVVFAGAIIQPHSQIGDHVIVNTAASIGHDCIINDYVHIAPGTHLAGTVCVEEGSFIGVGSSVIPEMHIGQWATIGAGSVVVKSVPDFALAKGVPARVAPCTN